MKLSVSMWTFQELIYGGAMDFAAFAEYCASRGVRHVELLDFFVLDKLDECLAIMDELGLSPAVWSICNDFVQADEDKRLEQIQYMIQQIDIAKRIGAPVMRVFSGDVKDGVALEDGMDSIKACYAPSIRYAEEAGIKLCLENHGVFAARSGEVAELLDTYRSPSFRSTFDTANFLFVDEAPEEAAERLKGRVDLLHLKDYRLSAKEGEGWPSLNNVWYTGCPLGQGDIPFDSVIETLRSGGFDGTASIELECDDPIASCDESIAFLRRAGYAE